MKKHSLLYSMAAAVAIGFALSACDNGLEVANDTQTTPQGMTRVATEHECFGVYESNFIAGQNEMVGKISICNDYENVYVTFTTQNGWKMQKIHLYIGSKAILLDPANGYVNKQGQPANGKFPYGGTFDPRITEWVFALPLTDLYANSGLIFGEAPNPWEEAEFCPVVAAHAEVVKVDASTGEIIDSQTAWGDGTKFNTGKKGNWSMYIEGYCTVFPKPDPEEPTACYGYKGGETACAMAVNEKEILEFDSKDWFTYIAYTGVETTYNICVGRNHIFAGTVVLSPAEQVGYVNMKFNIAVGSPENVGKLVINLDEKEPIKVQGYAANEVPAEKPSPGLCKDFKGYAKEINVPYNPFYFIHLDMAMWSEVECPKAQ